AIGTPGADRCDRVPRDESDRRLHRVLNRCRVVLRLPTGVLGAVILHDGGDATAKIRHVNRAESRSGAALPVSDLRSLLAPLPRECCARLPDRPCPCTPAPDPASCPLRSSSPAPIPASRRRRP